jgi:NADH-quinone oxidoreductase subunit J
VAGERSDALTMFSNETIAMDVFFVLLAVPMLLSAWRVVTTKNVVHAALYLVVVLAGVAANYILLASEFVAISQVLVYIGAIVVLFLFGIMLTRAELGSSDDLDNGRPQKLVGLVVALLLVGTMGWSLWDRWRTDRIGVLDPQNQPLTIVQLGQTTQQVSDSIFGTYLVAFEVASVMLLAALIGAIVLARRD